MTDPNQVSKKQSNLLGDSSAGTVSYTHSVAKLRGIEFEFELNYLNPRLEWGQSIGTVKPV